MSVDKVFQPRRARAFVTRTGSSAIESPIHIVRVALTATQIKAMSVTPVQLIPAPAAGHAILLRSLVFKVVRTGTAFANGGTTFPQYHTTTTSLPSVGAVPAAIITTGGAATVYHYLGPNAAATGMVLPSAEAIDLTNDTAPFITGTGTMEVFVEYSIVKTIT